MRKKKERTQRIVLLLLYLAGLAAGLLVFLAVPYFSHKRELIAMAVSAAKSYSSEGNFGTSGTFGLEYLVFDREGHLLDQALFGFPDMAVSIDVEKYETRLNADGPGLYYDRLEISMESKTTRRIALVAAAPIQEADTWNGTLFLIRELESLPNNLTAFVATWTVLFLMLFLFLWILDKKEQELENLQRTYIAGMNHELKSPITSIKALSETLLDGYVTDPEKQLFYYGTILKEADHLEDTVLKILELSKLQSTKALYKKEWVLAEKVFGPILDRYANLCEDVEIQFEAPNFHAAPMPKLYTAPALASRMLDLLLHNAFKFTDPENGLVRVALTPGRGVLTVSVRDNGCGVPPDALPFLFDRFYQAENAHDQTGSGLGLSLVKEMADGLHETLRVESEPGKGSVFSFTISTKA
ncbi:MAG: HAMP domain-containing sensor histidine kinase [Eubacteriales bacterium]|nr:HAMP domain-containing sensor histidine kinase [Eubacteriales bacterium]